MSSVKISGLPASSNLNVNPAQSIFPTVDYVTGQTTQISGKALGTSLYANNTLIVGTGGVLLPNTVTQFTGFAGGYVQVNEQNLSNTGSADYIVTADIGTDLNYYIDMGITNSQYNNTSPYNSLSTSIEPLSGYLYVQGNYANNAQGNLVIGTVNAGTETRFIAGGSKTANVIFKINSTAVTITNTANLVVNTITTPKGTNANLVIDPDGLGDVIFPINTDLFIQSGSASTSNNTGALMITGGIGMSGNLYSGGVYITGAGNGITFVDGTKITSNTNFVQNTAVVQLQALTLTGNLIANSTGQGIFVDKFTSNSATFSQNMVVLGNLTANTLLGNIFFSNVVTQTSQSNSIIWYPQAFAPTQQIAQLWYSSNTQSLILDTDIPSDRLSISKVLFFRGFNSTGATIPANSFVRLISGVTANQIPYLALADATNSANATVAGFVKNSIANGAYGFAYTQGIVEDLNSTGLGSNGDILFLSTTPGVASNVAPLSGNSNTVVQLGRVILNDATQGKLFIQNQLRQAYGRTSGSLLYAFANNITSSNTISINDATGVLNANTIIANTFVYGSATANSNVTQLTNKSTAVTSNGISGVITMNNAALAGQAYVTFTVNNSYVQHVNDIIIVNVQNGVTSPNPYIVTVGKVAVGSFNITVYNADSGGGSSHSDAIVLNYAVMRVGN